MLPSGDSSKSAQKTSETRISAVGLAPSTGFTGGALVQYNQSNFIRWVET